CINPLLQQVATRSSVAEGHPAGQEAGTAVGIATSSRGGEVHVIDGGRPAALHTVVATRREPLPAVATGRPGTSPDQPADRNPPGAHDGLAVEPDRDMKILGRSGI